MNIIVRRVEKEDKAEWIKMRKGIWPEASNEDLAYDMEDVLASDSDIVFIASVGEQSAGMIEASVREYGEGCETSPVGYIEAWFVYGDFRRTGVAAELVKSAENWAREKGCTEMGSDTWLENEVGIRAHQKLGYHEVERLVHFVKQL